VNATPTPLPLQHASEAVVPAPVDRVFAHLDDHARLTSHMERSSWMLGGGNMHVELDAARGQSVGSRIAMSGRAFGFRLALEEVVTERRPPSRKTWETRGAPRLLVIGPYRLGFDLASVTGGSKLRVVIDYALPETGPGRLLGWLFGPAYARWCTQRMVDDAVAHFAVPTGGRQSDGQ
jgi:hypothetical protein